ncbi:MAG: zf-HC2 domain-containing protein [bacterium]|nr:zf-HC2 domain-containing protein [bacterium]
MDCRNIQRVIYEFIYDEADERKLMTIKAHLDKCKECKEEAEAIAGILRRIKEGAKMEEVPQTARERMLKEIHRKAAVKVPEEM